MFGIRGKNLPLSCFFFSEWLRRNGGVLCEVVDFFENSDFEFFGRLVLNDLELTPEETDLLFVPLKGSVDVLVKLERRVLTVLVRLSKIVKCLRVVAGGDDVYLRVESYFALLSSRLTSLLRSRVLVHGAKYLIE